jgi:hypothetical protein
MEAYCLYTPLTEKMYSRKPDSPGPSRTGLALQDRGYRPIAASGNPWKLRVMSSSAFSFGPLRLLSWSYRPSSTTTLR